MYLPLQSLSVILLIGHSQAHAKIGRSFDFSKRKREARQAQPVPSDRFVVRGFLLIVALLGGCGKSRPRRHPRSRRDLARSKVR